MLCGGEDPETGLCFGRSWAESPDVDGLIYFDGTAKAGEFVEVIVTGAEDGELFGEVVKE